MNLLQLAAAYPVVTCSLVAVAGIASFFPAQALLVLRWIIGTEPGRYLLIAALVVAAFAWFRADAFADGVAAELTRHREAEKDAALKVAQLELENRKLSDAATERARADSDDRAKNLTAGVKHAEGIAREPRAPVPAVCPEPDARLVRLFPERDEAAEALAGQLRDLRRAEGGPAARTDRKP